MYTLEVGSNSHLLSIDGKCVQRRVIRCPDDSLSISSFVIISSAVAERFRFVDYVSFCERKKIMIDKMKDMTGVRIGIAYLSLLSYSEIELGHLPAF